MNNLAHTIVKESNLAPGDWNALVAHPMQSWEWGEVRKREGKEIVRFVCTDLTNAPTQAYLMTLHPIPHTQWSVGYVPKSPIPSAEVLHYLSSWCSSRGVIFVKFEPNTTIERSTQSSLSGLAVSPHPLFTLWNQVLDTRVSEQDLLEHMHPKTRYNIRLAKRKGVQVQIENNEEGYRIFEKLYFETCARQRYRGHTPSYHQNIWHTLHERQQHEYITDDTGLQNYIIIARYHGEPIASYQLWHFKKTMYYVYGGSADVYKETMASNLLMWESILFAQRLGCVEFDMWGSLAPTYASSDPWAGFTKFKQGYGTKFVQYAGSFDLVLEPMLYRVYNAIHTLRKRFLLI